MNLTKRLLLEFIVTTVIFVPIWVILATSIVNKDFRVIELVIVTYLYLNTIRTGAVYTKVFENNKN